MCIRDRVGDRGEPLQDESPTTGVGTGPVATGSGAILVELVLGERVPAAVFDLDPAELGPKRGEVEFDLGGSRSVAPRHDEPRRRIPGRHHAPIDGAVVVPDLEYATADFGFQD